MKTKVFCLSVFLFLAGFSVSQANELFGVTASQDRGFLGKSERIELFPIGPFESVLYQIDPRSGNAAKIGPTGYRACVGLDFKPGTDDLYAICRNIFNGEEPIMFSRGEDEEGDILIKIDLNTGEGEEVGPLLIEDSNPITRVTDMSFDENGVLYVYVVNVSGDDFVDEDSLQDVDTKYIFDEDDRLGIVNLDTGKYTEIGPTGFINLLSGIAFSQAGDLYQAGGQKINLLSILNLLTGDASTMAPLIYPPEIAEYLNLVMSMDLQSSTNSLFAVIRTEFDGGNRQDSATRNGIGNETRLMTLNPSNGDLSTIGLTVDDLSAIAFLNRGRTQIPTLSDWSLISLSGVLLLMAVFYLRRRAQA